MQACPLPLLAPLRVGAATAEDRVTAAHLPHRESTSESVSVRESDPLTAVEAAVVVVRESDRP